MMWLAVIVVPLEIALSSLWSAWWAGYSYGPRYMAETLPFLFLLALPFVDWLGARIRRPTDDRRPGLRTGALVATALLVGISVFVNAEGGLIRGTRCWNVDPERVDLHPSRVWSVSDPQVFYGVRLLVAGHFHTALSGQCAAPTPAPAGATASPGP
jgi:hypothetical protein